MMAGIGGSDSKNPDHDASKLYAEQEDVYVRISIHVLNIF